MTVSIPLVLEIASDEADWTLRYWTTFTLPETIRCTVHYCRALPCTALCSAATIPLKCLQFVASFDSYLHQYWSLMLLRQDGRLLTQYPVPENYCMENGQWLIAIFSTDCMFGFGAAKPTGACLLSLSSVFKVWTPFVSRTDSPLTSGRMLLHSLLPQLNKDSECIWSMVLHLWCSNWGTILYILTILSFTVLYCTFEHVLCQCVCVCVCVHMCVCSGLTWIVTFAKACGHCMLVW